MMVLLLLVAGAVLSFISPLASVVAAGASLAWALFFGASMTELISLLVGFSTLLFALWYLKEEHLKKEFFSAMAVFLAAMLLFLQSADWIQMYIAWEFMGFCSYILIAQKSTIASRKAARKAFIFSRLSGVCFLAAVALIYAQTGSFSFSVIPALPAVLLLVAAMAKSSQFPFFWLHDAMEAPTPASALLHSATMVAAGPLLLARFPDFFVFLLPAIKIWAAVSIAVASFAALVQEHQKKVLAFSTVAAVAFLYTIFDSALLPWAFSVHALLKSALFLLVGTYASSVNYSMEVGLDKRSRTSYLTLFIILALSGVPPFGLFWFKAAEGPIAALTVFLSLLYFLRSYFLTFSGGVKPQESIGTLLAGVLAAVSIPLSIHFFSVPQDVLSFFLSAIAIAFVSFRFSPLQFIGNAANWLASYEPRVDYVPEGLIDKWGYDFGISVRHASKKIHSLFTGPVSKDIGYIALSLAALALGVKLC